MKPTNLAVTASGSVVICDLGGIVFVAAEGDPCLAVIGAVYSTSGLCGTPAVWVSTHINWYLALSPAGVRLAGGQCGQPLDGVRRVGPSGGSVG